MALQKVRIRRQTKKLQIEDPCSDSTALGHKQIGLELTAERLGPNGARRSQAAGNALAFAVQGAQVLRNEAY